MKRFACLGGALAALCLAQQVVAQEWVALQDGKTLAGWKAPERPESWAVEDGVFVTRGERSHLYYVGKVSKHDFRNFEISLDVMTSPGANSGVYVHTKLQPEGWPAAGYELQVINSNPPAEKMNGYIEHKMTGSIVKYRNIKVRILPNDAAPPAGLIPLADPELDQLVGQASDDNIPLIDLGLAPPSTGADAFWSAAHRLGITPGSEWSAAELTNYLGSVLVIVDRDKAPDVAVLQAAKAAGVKVAFSSGGTSDIDEARLKRRLQAIKAAGLGWKDFWMPGKP